MDTIEIAGWTLDAGHRTLSNGTASFNLSKKMVGMLKMFFESPNIYIDREVFLKALWGDDSYFNGRSMDVFISKIRKILNTDDALRVVNRHSYGFKLEVQ